MLQPRLRDTLASFRHALRLAWRSSPRLALTQTLLVTLQALLPLVSLYALKQAVDAAGEVYRAAPREGGRLMELAGQIMRDPHMRGVALWFMVGAAVMAALAVLRAVLAWVAEQHAMAVSDHVHGLLHRKLAEVDLAYFENVAEQNRLHLVQEQAMTRPVGALDALYQLLRSGVSLLGVLALLAVLHPLLPVILLLAGVPALALRLRRSRRLYEWRRGLAPLEREAGYFHRILTAGEWAKEIRLQGHGSYCRGRFESVRRRLRAARLVWRRRILGEELAMQFLNLAIAAALLLWMTGRLLGGALTLGALVMYAQAVQRGQGQAGNLTSALFNMHQASLFLASFEELLGLPTQVKAPPAPRPVPAPLRQGLAFEHVSFAYPGTGREVLRDVTFTLRAGERLAVVGANGAGKSTLVKLIARLYDPTAGRILADGIDLREFDPAEWRRRVGVLFQDFGRYQLTAAENIWIGDPSGAGAAADSRIAAAAGRAGLEEIIAAWPAGLATPLGRWLHEGVEPSMGQWQRIALARAFLRDAGLLVLDEPTSALDTRVQRDILDRLRSAAAGRTTLVVSHRPEMLAWAQRAVVLRAGEPVEIGTVEELRSHRGEFSRLFDGPGEAEPS